MNEDDLKSLLIVVAGATAFAGAIALFVIALLYILMRVFVG